MSWARVLLLAWLAMAGGAETVFAGTPMRCLNAEHRRAAIAAHKAVPLARAMRAARGRNGGGGGGARLCESGSGLVYLLTLLSRDGKVTRATVDAGTGRLISGR